MADPSDPFDFSHVDWDGTTHPRHDVTPSTSKGPAPAPDVRVAGSPTVATTAVDHPASVDRARLAWFGLALGALASVLIGVGAHRALATVDVTSLNPVRTALDWATVATVGIVLVPVAVVVTGVALARRRATLSWVALVVALVMPPAAGLLGVETGLRSFSGHLAADVRDVSTVGLDTLDAALRQAGLPAEPLREWLEDELAED